MSDFPWMWRATWAPTIIEKDKKYYLMFATNDIQSNDEIGGLEIAVADNPAGPFRGYLDKPLIDKFISGAQPIDAHLFVEKQEPVAIGPGHHGYLQIPGTDEWLIVYHRRIIGEDDPGARILCIDKMKIDNGTIEKVIMTHEW
jgi:GH43 family beta-xylosidase